MIFVRHLVGLVVLLSLVACGATSSVSSTTYAALKQMTQTPVKSRAESEQRSRELEAALNDNAFAGMTRAEVSNELGPGDDCSRHPECNRQGFFDQDWYYTMGTHGSRVAPPVLIIGFDQFGRVERTWNLRTHP